MGAEVIERLWHWLNRAFGMRSYSKVGGKAYIKEGFNPPEELLEHLKKYHPEEYAELRE